MSWFVRRILTGEIEEPDDVHVGRLGRDGEGPGGGKARCASMTLERHAKIAREAATALCGKTSFLSRLTIEKVS